MSAGVDVAPATVGSRAALRESRAPSAEAGEVVFEVRGLCHTFSKAVVLDGVGFTLKPGEMLGLLGPNGCGKSTTLRVITGLLVPEAGQLFWRGREVAPGDRTLRNAMGVVFQTPSLDARLTARENLTLAARLYGCERRALPARVGDALAFAQLETRADEPTGQLSGGMKRRLELARALLHQPELLLLDEPTTGLDEVSFQRAWERISALRERFATSVVLATHRADEAASCDRVAVLDHGRVVACDTPQALIDRVSGDVITLEVADPQPLVEEIQRRFGLQARVLEGALLLERERAHELIPRLVEALPAGSIRSLSMHRPTLADVFVKLTGHSLGAEAPQP